MSSQPAQADHRDVIFGSSLSEVGADGGFEPSDPPSRAAFAGHAGADAIKTPAPEDLADMAFAQEVEMAMIELESILKLEIL